MCAVCSADGSAPTQRLHVANSVAPRRLCDIGAHGCCDDALREPDMEFLHLIVVERGSRVPVNRYIDCSLINGSAADVAACLKETHLRSSAPSVSY